MLRIIFLCKIATGLSSLLMLTHHIQLKKKKKVIYTYTGGHHVKNVIKKLWGFISKARASAFESIEASYLYPTLSSSI